MELIKKEQAIALSEKGRVVLREKIVRSINESIEAAAVKGLRRCKVEIDYSNSVVKAVIDNEVSVVYSCKLTVNSKGKEIAKIDWRDKKKVTPIKSTT